MFCNHAKLLTTKHTLLSCIRAVNLLLLPPHSQGPHHCHHHRGPCLSSFLYSVSLLGLPSLFRFQSGSHSLSFQLLFCAHLPLPCSSDLLSFLLRYPPVSFWSHLPLPPAFSRTPAFVCFSFCVFSLGAGISSHGLHCHPSTDGSQLCVTSPNLSPRTSDLRFQLLVLYLLALHSQHVQV